MLNNMTNFLNLIRGRKIKTAETVAATDLIPLGTKDANYGGGYQPTAIEYDELKKSIIGDIVPVDLTCLPEFRFKDGSVGDKVSFKKVAGSDPNSNKDVIIPGQLEITRGNGGGGIYNIAQESNFNGSVSPKGTVWNTQYLTDTDTSWAPLWDITNRTFDNWRDAIKTPQGNYAPPQYVGMPAVMRFVNPVTHTIAYYLIMFTEWGVGAFGQEGAFAYDRWEIYPQVNFTKVDYDNTAVDIVSEGVHLKRNNNGPLYNAVTENYSEVGVSPTNTKWNSIYTDTRAGYSGFSDLSNLESRVYTDFALALDYNVGNNILDTDLIMWDLTTDLYYRVQFNDWTQGGNGGGFSYRRIVIPQSCPIKFADGSVMTTAPNGSTGVQSVTQAPVIGGENLHINNTDPQNPVLSFLGVYPDNTTITGNGTFSNPLVAPFQSPSVDGVTITGDGTPGNPLVAAGASLPAWLESNATDLTIWNNGKGNVATNTSFGEKTLSSNTSGSSNTAYGYRSLENNTTTSYNTAIGANTLFYNTGGQINTAVGDSSLYNNTTGGGNTAIGYSSLLFNSVGSSNVAVGSNSLLYNSIGSANSALGNASLYFNTGSNNTAVGNQSLFFNTSGNNNSTLGESSLRSNTTGSNNVAVGNNALYNNTTGVNNTSVGTEALYQNTTGNNNIAIGPAALFSNNSGSNNTAIGYGTESGNFSSSVIIGRGATANGNNQFVVGSSVFNAGTVTNAAAVQSHYWTVKINGTDYKILLST